MDSKAYVANVASRHAIQVPIHFRKRKDMNTVPSRHIRSYTFLLLVANVYSNVTAADVPGSASPKPQDLA